MYIYIYYIRYMYVYVYIYNNTYGVSIVMGNLHKGWLISWKIHL